MQGSMKIRLEFDIICLYSTRLLLEGVSIEGSEGYRAGSRLGYEIFTGN